MSTMGEKRNEPDMSAAIWPGRVMLLLLRDYATFDYAKFAILERDYATHYASIIRYATKAPNYFLGGLCY